MDKATITKSPIAVQICLGFRGKAFELDELNMMPILLKDATFRSKLEKNEIISKKARNAQGG